MRILTIGAKSTINQALIERADVDVWTMSVGDDVPANATHPLPYDRRGKIHLSSVRQVRDAIRQSRADVIHAFYPRPLAHAVLAATSLGSRVPIVSFRGITSTPQRWSPDQWITYLSPRVAAHACESAAVCQSLASVGVPTERCHVVHNCLGKSETPISRTKARAELGLADDAFVVMMVANMRHVKGADLLLKAAIECRQLANMQVALVGRVLDAEVEKLVSDPRLVSRVQQCGFQPRASRLLKAADLFVMPSRAEALCVALLEAMTAGLCPVVSDAGGMKEAVRHAKDGIVFPSEDVSALSSAITRLHADRDLLATYAASAQSRVERDFSSTAVADRLMQIYRSVLGTARHAAA